MTERTLAEITKLIADHAAFDPITNREIGRRLGLDERSVKAAVQQLRRRGLPIGSNRQPPYGYYWMETPEEMEAFARQYRAQALNELRLLNRMIKLNFPAMSGQLRLPLEDEINE